MQEQKASKAPNIVARLGLRNIIWLAVFGSLMLTAAIVWLRPHCGLTTSCGREAHNTLPWENEGIRVNEVKGHWMSSEGNERMMLRTAFYPVAEVTLSEAQGRGMLYIYFEDERGRRAGDPIYLTYANGEFTPREDMDVKAEGNKARVFIEAGYTQASEFELHCCDASSPLWRIHLRYRPEGKEAVTSLGSVTIPARCRDENN